MIFSHISDTHLGFIQYHSEEREDDVYSAFNQAIDTSINDHVDFVIFAGDIFHVPTPSGKAILVLANALKRLKENSIDSFFILGEHDISRIRATPVPFVYHNLGFSRYIGNGKPLYHKDVLVMGYDKRRKSEIHTFENDFAVADNEAKNHYGHKILVLHQGISEINKFAGELSSTDLPRDFTYYAMGHLHEKELKKFAHLNGSVFMERPMKIEDEIFTVAKEILHSDELANFAIHDLLPILAKGNSEEANHIVSENFYRMKEVLKNVTIS